MKFCVFVSSCCSLYHESGFNYCVSLQGSVGASKSKKVGKFGVCFFCRQIWSNIMQARFGSIGVRNNILCLRKSRSKNCVPPQGSVGASKSENCQVLWLHFADRSGRINSVVLQGSLAQSESEMTFCLFVSLSPKIASLCRVVLAPASPKKLANSVFVFCRQNCSNKFRLCAG